MHMVKKILVQFDLAEDRILRTAEHQHTSRCQNPPEEKKVNGMGNSSTRNAWRSEAVRQSVLDIVPS